MVPLRGVSCLVPVVALASLFCVADAEKALKLADAALVKGDYDTAISHYDEAIRLDPRFARPYHGRGVAYFHKGQYAKATASYTKAIELDPKNDDALFDRGLAHWRNGEPKGALLDFTQATKVNPKNDGAYNGVAWVLATTHQADLRDGKRAVAFAKRACELTEWKDPLHFSALAAAYAEAGDFEKAVSWHKKAMAAPAFPKEKLERARERLRLYEQGKPYREGKEKK